jgi:drug/metabolite transporter (DMT)-like permease
VLSWREWTAVAAVVVGVGLLGSSAGAQGAASVGTDFHLALIAALAAITVAGVAAARLPSRIRTPTLGGIAGLGYGVLAVCARILPGFSPDQLVRSPAAYTLAAAGVVSFMFYASALESGSVTVATAAVILVETVPPAIVGVLLLGDTTRPGLTGLAVAGFLLALVSAIALARFGEAGGHGPAAQPATGQPAGSAAGASAGRAEEGRAAEADAGEAGAGEAGADDTRAAQAGTALAWTGHLRPGLPGSDLTG